MLITPQQIINYTEFEVVKNRLPAKLEMDIIQAEAEIKRIVNHDFSTYSPLPKDAEAAAIKLAEFFALINSDESITKGYTGEKIGDYSYTLSSGQTIRKPDVSALLEPYIMSEPVKVGNTYMRMRAI